MLDLPFDILKKDVEKILRKSGIADWDEDVTHLRNQMSKEHPGCCSSFVLQQKKQDERRKSDRN